MKFRNLVLSVIYILFQTTMLADNVFLHEFKTTNGAVPFDKISDSDFEPAINHGIKMQNQEIDSIVNQSANPTFENTILAFERSGKELNRVLGVFYPLLSANATDSIIAISNKIAPVLSAHSNGIYLNGKLWQRVKFVKEHFDASKHDAEDAMLLDKTYDAFIRNGAGLNATDGARYKELCLKLTNLQLKFDENSLKATNAYELWLDESDLAGLPQSAVSAAKAAAAEKNDNKRYLITLHAPSYTAFMKYSSRRDLREKLYKAYNTQCTSGEFSNMEIINDIANTRLEIAHILGSKNYAEYHLKDMMAQNQETVYDMLNKLRAAYAPRQKSDMAALCKFASKLENKPVVIKPWDYAYYSNKLKESQFEINDEELRPYFELNKVINGVFGLAHTLYGLNFDENFDAQVYHPEVRTFNVTDSSGKFMGLLYTDFFPRSTKQSGAWMTNFREQYVDESGNDIRPLVTLTMNFTRPTDDKPSLLTFNEVTTFLHEFGHALHSLLSECKYASLSGTNVDRDFVELPSQFNENFAYQREFLDSFAMHYKTHERIPQALIDKIIKSSQFGAAYSCMRQLGFGFIDLAWHTISKPVSGDPISFEHKALKPVEVFAPIEQCAISPQFGHIFSGGYAAGYYGYKWAEILDADVFSKFKADGMFDKRTSAYFKEKVLSKGGTRPPMLLFEDFMHRKPSIDALLKRDGIKN